MVDIDNWQAVMHGYRNMRLAMTAKKGSQKTADGKKEIANHPEENRSL
ncbi:MAG: hypothetical protein ACLS6W_10770 [Ruminococcus sp.]